MLRLILAVALVLAFAGAASAGIISWKGYDWETQPQLSYTAGSTTVDSGTNQLWQNAASAGSKIGWIGIAPAGQRFSFAKLASPISGIITQVHARVYENSYTSQGPSMVIKSATNQYLSVGCQPANGTSYYYRNLSTDGGATWTNSNWITRGKTSYSNYLELTYAVNGTGGIDVTAIYSSAPDYVGYTGTYTWSTPAAFGAISEVWLVQAQSATHATDTSKWTAFDMTVTAVPEPSSLIVLLGGLPVVGFAIRRRK